MEWLFDIGTVLQNPFGPLDIDLEHYKVCRDIKGSLVSEVIGHREKSSDDDPKAR